MSEQLNDERSAREVSAHWRQAGAVPNAPRRALFVPPSITFNLVHDPIHIEIASSSRCYNVLVRRWAAIAGELCAGARALEVAFARHGTEFRHRRLTRSGCGHVERLNSQHTIVVGGSMASDSVCECSPSFLSRTCHLYLPIGMFLGISPAASPIFDVCLRISVAAKLLKSDHYR